MGGGAVIIQPPRRELEAIGLRPALPSRYIPRPARIEERVRVVATLDGNGAATIKLPRRRPAQPAIVSRLIAAIPTGTTQILLDTFTRVIANTWSSPDVGAAYARLGTGNTFDWDVAAGVGTYQQPGAGTGAQVSAPNAMLNGNVIAQVSGGTATSFIGVCFRQQGAADTYYAVLARLVNTPPIQINGIEVIRRDAGVTTVIAGPNAVTAFNPPGLIRGVIDGTVITGQVWPVGSAEPAAQINAIDLTYRTAGNVGAAGITAGAGDTLSWDNLVANATTASPIWDAYINSTDQLINLIDSSVIAIDRWIPQITNGQRLNPGEELIVAPRDGIPSTQAVVTCSFVYSA